MPILIEFHGTQRKLTNVSRIEMHVSDGITVGDAFSYVRQKYPSLHLEEGMVLMTVNLEVAVPDKTLKDGDKVSFLPIIGGG